MTRKGDFEDDSKKLVFSPVFLRDVFADSGIGYYVKYKNGTVSVPNYIGVL